VCLSPLVLAFGARGAAFVAVIAVSHALVDRAKIRATRHAEARALAAAHRRGAPVDDGEGLGAAWTPVPGALFALDQAVHVAITVAAWLVLLARASLTPEWVSVVGGVVGRFDGAAFHAATLTAVVLASLLIVNVRAGALFVGTLVRPRDLVSGAPVSLPEPLPEPPPPPTPWRLRIGRFVATAEPATRAAPAPASTRPARGGHALPARIGATIGVLERLLIVTFVLTGSTAAIGFVVAAKTLARFKQLDDRDFAEYYLLGTLASVAVALGSALVAQAALATLP
jgi:hypothetical protein